jgi:hypothetical protein
MAAQPPDLRMRLTSLQNITFLSILTKFKVVPPHLILHIFKVCLDDFSGTNVDNISMLLEGCGRFLLRNDETKQRFATMVSRNLDTPVLLSSLTDLRSISARAHEAQAKPAALRPEADSHARECVLPGQPA